MQKFGELKLCKKKLHFYESTMGRCAECKEDYRKVNRKRFSELRKVRKVLGPSYYQRNREKALAGMRAYKAANYEKVISQKREWHKKNVIQQRHFKMFKAYNLTSEQFHKMLENQNGVCAICFRAESVIDKRSGDVHCLSVDHDHKCCPGKTSCGKCIRGLLCNACNRLLGIIENIEEARLARAVKFITKSIVIT